MFAYRPPFYNNLIILFEELTSSVCKALNTYDNIIVMGDFNIDVNKGEGIGHDKIDVFCDTLKLTNLVKSGSCYTNSHKLTIGFSSRVQLKKVLAIIVD